MYLLLNRDHKGRTPPPLMDISPTTRAMLMLQYIYMSAQYIKNAAVQSL